MRKHNEPTSVVLVVDDTVHCSGAYYLRQESEGQEHRFEPRCAGVIEATDQELEILAGAGYRLTDLRNVGVPELLKSLGLVYMDLLR
jgi:hypothetical protein